MPALILLDLAVIAPGPVSDTEGYDRLSAGTEAEMQRQAASRVPIGRYGYISDIANTGVFLFSEAANWITGQVIVSHTSLRSGFGELSRADATHSLVRLSTEANCIRKT